jgi:hypothetical protein
VEGARVGPKKESTDVGRSGRESLSESTAVGFGEGQCKIGSHNSMLAR